MDPIAIIGMGCRLPGGVKSPQDLWELLMKKTVANTSRVPPSRFNVDAYHHPDNERPGSFNTPGGYFMEDNLEDFDPTLFSISPIEAIWMDPQQRKLLEVVYEAFENSGSTLKEVADQVTGCFVASFSSDFQQMTFKEPDFRHAYGTTGIDPGLLGNRISHVFDLRGPSIVLINTACSSSMYALDSACLAINRGECEGAIVGGVNLIMTLDQHMNTAKLGVLSPTSMCHTFDQAADGYGRAEAVGALYVKRLSAAVRDGNPIRAIVRSIATNSNGRHSENGITYPSVQGQVDAIHTAYKLENLETASTSYIECHGTGTPTGDPIEVQAVSQAMRVGTVPQEPILIGSIKPNIGHSEAASSICTVMKAVLSLERGIIPPTAGVNNLNNNIPWSSLNVKVVTEPIPLPDHLPVHRIGVNAFGYGGTNSHAIIESTTSALPQYHGHSRLKQANVPHETVCNRKKVDHAHLILFSAHNQVTLQNNVCALRKQCVDIDLLDLSHTLGMRRSEHDCRAFLVLQESSDDLYFDSALENMHQSVKETFIAFAFTGQGAQWAGMGCHLLQVYPSFLDTIRKLDDVLSGLERPPSWNLEATLTDPRLGDYIHNPEFSQPLCTAIQLALVDLLECWGIRPVASIGHSSGEIAAAYAAGLISAQEGIIIAYLRGCCVSNPSTQGAMLAIGAGAEEAEKYVKREDGLVIACYNSPKSVTVSGDLKAIESLKSSLDADDVFARMVRTGGQAYHSHHMETASLKYSELLHNELGRYIGTPSVKKAVPMFSSVTGRLIEGTSIGVNYWCENLTSPVRFNQAMQNLLSDGPNFGIMTEIGPHSTLSGAMRHICAEANVRPIAYLPSLQREKNDQVQLLQLSGRLWTHKVIIDKAVVTTIEHRQSNGCIVRKEGKLLVDLPPYQWTYTRKFWMESRQSREHRFELHPRHDILGRKILGTSSAEPIWRNILRHKDLPWLKHHSLGGEAIFPAAGYIAMALEAVAQANSALQRPRIVKSYTLKDVNILSALVIPDEDEGVEILFSLRSSRQISNVESPLSYIFTVSSFSQQGWKENATGEIGINVQIRGQQPKAHPCLPMRSTYASWNKKLQSLGFNFGPAFQNSTLIHTDGKTHFATADLAIKQACGLMASESRYVIHPASIDSCLQVSLIAIHKGRLNDVTYGTALTHFDEISIWPPTAAQVKNGNARVASWMSQHGTRSFDCNAQLSGYDGNLLADFQGFRCVPYEGAKISDVVDSHNDLYMKSHWELDLDEIQHVNGLSIVSQLTLARLLEMFAHKLPESKAVIFGVDSIKHLPEAPFRTDMAIFVNTKAEYEYLQSLGATEKTMNIFQLDDLSALDKQCQWLNSVGLVVFSEGCTSKDMPKALEPFLKDNYYAIEMESPSGPAECSSDKLYGPYSFAFQGFRAVLRKTKGNKAPYSGLSTGLISTSIENCPSLLAIYSNNLNHFQKEIIAHLQTNGFKVRSSKLSEALPMPQEFIVVIAELESSLFFNLEVEQLTALQRMTNHASHILWITWAGLQQGLRPESTIANGWARVIRTENEHIRFVTIDIDDAASSKMRLQELLVDTLTSLATGCEADVENEYSIDDGATYISRLVPERDINAAYTGVMREPKVTTLEDAPALHGKLVSGKIIFQPDERVEEFLEPHEIEVQVRAIGLDKDTAIVHGGADSSPFLNHQMSGVIRRVGSNVPSYLKVNDSVFGFSFDHMATLQRTRYDLVQKICGDELWERLATVPSALSTALYALEDLSRVQKDETVVIFDDCGLAGLFALQICNSIGAHAILIACSDDNNDLFRSSAVSDELIVRSDREDMSDSLKQRHNGRGVDVVLCSSSTNFLLVDSFRKELRPFVRIVVCGRQIDPKHLPLLAVQNPSIHWFDIRTLYENRPDMLARLFQKAVELYNAGIFKPVWPFVTKTPIEITEALRADQRGVRLGGIALSCAPTSMIKYREQPKRLQFSDQATYLLVGCLGGLGRSLSSWMIEKGASRLAFLSRSGTDKSAAAELVASIRKSGVNVQVLRADVTSKAEVQDALDTLDPRFPIRGVVNAAAVIKDRFFHNMDIECWNQVLNPKVKGALVLHELFPKARQLDFFVVTSSISATLGAAGQSNYAAANSFLNGLARHRRMLGLSAVSLILPAITGVGYLTENPGIEASIRRRGLSCIDEVEMLHAFGISMRPMTELPSNFDHVIAGFQPMQLAQSIKAAEADLSWTLDPQFRVLSALIKEYLGTNNAVKEQSILTLIETAPSKDDAVSRVENHLSRRLSRLLMIDSTGSNSSAKSLANLGLDSMVGAEFRNWIFHEFRIHIPFQQLLDRMLTIKKLAIELIDRLNSIRK